MCSKRVKNQKEEMKYFIRFAILTGLLLLAQLSCSQKINDTLEATVVADAPKVGKPVKEHRSQLTDDSSKYWTGASKRISKDEKLRSMFFLDEVNGWIGGINLYRTRNGGESWRPVEIQNRNDAAAEVADILFLNEDQGWIILQEKFDGRNVSEYKNSRSWLLSTKDGGRNWKQVFQKNGVIADKISIAKDKIAWIEGTSYSMDKFYAFSPFLAVSVDEGKNWADVSEQLGIAVKSVEDLKNEWISTSSFTENVLTLITSEEQIFKSSDLGNTWHYHGQLTNEPGQTKVFNITSLKNAKHVLGGGAFTGIEGVWGMVAREYEDYWERFRLQNANFAHMNFASEAQYFASGSTLSEQKTAYQGSIMLSDNGGADWRVLFKTASSESISRFVLFGNSKILAISENGHFFNLSKNH